jgi:hypothetical protein
MRHQRTISTTRVSISHISTPGSKEAGSISGDSSWFESVSIESKCAFRCQFLE